VQASGDVVAGPHPRSLAGWQAIYPAGLYDLLVRIKQDYGDIPLSITENGIPTNDILDGDTVDHRERVQFLVWSLLDNFEWAAGYSQRWCMSTFRRNSARQSVRAVVSRRYSGAWAEACRSQREQYSAQLGASGASDVPIDVTCAYGCFGNAR